MRFLFEMLKCANDILTLKILLVLIVSLSLGSQTNNYENIYESIHEGKQVLLFRRTVNELLFYAERRD